MPSCQKFFDALAECIMASSCINHYDKQPNDCIESLVKAKLYNRSISSPDSIRGKIPIPPPEPFAPIECDLHHQAYTECRIAIMNPRNRFRTPYGGAQKKEQAYNDELGSAEE